MDTNIKQIYPENQVYLPTSRPAERTLKQLIWLYFWLLLFEGALRKWVLPGLSNPLLIIRDPIAISIIWIYVNNGYRLWNFYTIIIIFSAFFSLVVAIGSGHGNLWVSLYGFRIYAFHFPIIFIIGEIFNRKDVEKIGKVLMYLIIPVTILVALQYYSPQSAWVNRGIGGDLEGAGFSGAAGYFRPAGLFSFTVGNSLLYGLAAAFMFYFWQNRSKLKQSILILSTAAIIITVPLSISRTYVFQLTISFLFLVVASIIGGKSLFSMLRLAVILPIIFLVVAQFDFVSTGMEVITLRFEHAGISEGGLEGTITNRFLGGLINPLEPSDDRPLLGYGLGMGTNVGSMLLTGEVTYLIDEGEVGRVIGEQGMPVGIINMLTRLLLGLTVALLSFKALRLNNALPWMMLSFSFLGMFTGLWGQPTSLGFSVLAMGLTIAALKDPAVEQ